MTSANKNILIEASIWLTVAASVFSSVFFFDDIKAGARSLFEAGGNSAAEIVRNWKKKQNLEKKTTRDQESADNFGRSVHLTSRRGGHFFARAWINGRQIDVMVDTGATGVALTSQDAETVGVFVGASDFTRRSRTANGIVKSAPVILDSIRIGDIEVDDVRASVSQEGRLHITLLGMTFLGKLSRVEIKGDRLVLTQ